MPDSRNLPRNDLPAHSCIKRRVIGTQRTLYTLIKRWKLGKREIWLGAETKHLFPTRYRERQVWARQGLLPSSGKRTNGINVLWWWEKQSFFWKAICTNVDSCITLTLETTEQMNYSFAPRGDVFSPLSTGKSFHKFWLSVSCQQPC